jgi:predicted lipid-binding transport protein (Tim44 family)
MEKHMRIVLDSKTLAPTAKKVARSSKLQAFLGMIFGGLIGGVAAVHFFTTFQGL